VFSNRPLDYTLGHAVWFITSAGGKGSHYRLESAFVVSQAGPCSTPGFLYQATGQGICFPVPVPLNDLHWFPELLQSMGNFGLGVRQTTQQSAIDGLVDIARRNGWHPA